MKPLISVIIPAHNEEKYLGKTLQALREQSYPYFEVIVVANGCTDRTTDAARARCDKLIDLPEKALGQARNTGAAKARGDLLVFLDADTLLDREALASIACEFKAEHSSGTLRGQADSTRLACRFLYLLKNALHRSQLYRGSSGVIVCWRDQFKEIGGFDPRLNVRENSELMRRLRRFGSYKFIADASALTSMRRYERAGTARVMWRWFTIWLRSLLSDLRNHSYDVVR